LYGIHSITQDDKISVVYIKNPPDIPGMAFITFSALSEENIDVDLILQTASQNRGADIIFTIHDSDIEKTEHTLRRTFQEHPNTDIVIDSNISKITVSGEGMQGKPGVAAKVFKCLWDSGIKIINISTSEIRICMLVPAEQGRDALIALVECFDIEL